MKRRRYTAVVLSAAIVLGLAAGITVNTDLVEKTFTQQETHEHALFFIDVNGTQIDLTKERFQLQDREVHLENNRSHIVHKHASGVTWKQFLDTVNISITTTGNQTCLKMPQNTYCGNMTVLLNGEEFDPEKEIQQNDNLAIVIGNQTQQRAEAYMELELPDAYRKRIPGTRV